MAELGIIDCLEFVEGKAPQRWFLVRTDALLALTELSWSRERAQATRFSAEVADELTGKRRGDLPLLPTQPTKVPAFIRVVWGGAEEEAVKLTFEAKAPTTREVPPPRATRDIPERIEAARHQKRVMASGRPVSECDALSRWEAEHEG